MSKSEQFDLRLNRRQMMLMSGAACAYGMCGKPSFGQEVAGLNGKFFCTAHGPIRSEQAKVTAEIAKRSPAAAARIQSKAPARGLGTPAAKEIHRPLQLALDTESLWRTKEVTYQFIDGDLTLQGEIENAFNAWHPHTGLDFRRVNSGGQIKIAFRNQGSWSYVGMYAVDSGKPITLNIQPGNVGEYRRATLHEVGHALGAIHEHQAPSAANIPWNVAALNAYYSAHFNWTPQDVQEQVIDLYQGNVSNSAFDNTSIMVYVIPQEVLQPGADPKFVVPTFNQELSLTDKNFMRKIYGISPLSGDNGGTQSRTEIRSDRQKLKGVTPETLTENTVATGKFPSDPQMHLYKVEGAGDFVLETVDGPLLQDDGSFLGGVLGSPMPVVLELFNGTDFSQDKAIKVSMFGDAGSIGVQDAFLKYKLVSGTTYYVMARPQQRLSAGAEGTYKLLLRRAVSGREQSGIKGSSWRDLKDKITEAQKSAKGVQAETITLQGQLRK